MHMPSLRPVFIACALLASLASTALAGDMGGITGTITDANTGAPLSGVHLDIASPSSSASATTDAKGHFSALFLPPDDRYTVTMTKDGYYSRTLSGYAVYADQTQHYDLQLVPAASPKPSGGGYRGG